MNGILIALLVVVVLAVVLIAWVVGLYNGLVVLKNRFKNAFAQIDVQLRRRYDLIPNLVNTVKGYAAHELETLQSVTDARTKATSVTIDPSTATPAQMEAWMEAQDEVNGALGRLIAVAESYPDLKANENFMQLQQQLEGTENRISTERRKYNEAVREYNVAIRRFPSNIIAGMFGFEKMELFEAAEGAEAVPVVEF